MPAQLQGRLQHRVTDPRNNRRQLWAPTAPGRWSVGCLPLSALIQTLTLMATRIGTYP